MRKIALFASLFVSYLCFADTNAERLNLDEPKVLKRIIEEAVELVALKKADGNLQYFESLEFLPFQGSGWGVTYYENKNQDSNKKLEALIQFLKGEPEGLLLTWYYNGQKQSVGSYKDGKLDGLVTFWYENGQKDREGKVKDGKEDGLWTEWYENGQKKNETNWKDGKQDGLSTFWYENGQMKEESNWKEGKLEGLLTGWYENGQKMNQILMRKNEAIDGNAWLPDGESCSVSDLKNGNGVLVFYDNDGTEFSRRKYNAGVEVNDANEKTKTPFDNSIPLPNLDEVAFPAIFPE